MKTLLILWMLNAQGLPIKLVAVPAQYKHQCEKTLQYYLSMSKSIHGECIVKLEA